MNRKISYRINFNLHTHTHTHLTSIGKKEIVRVSKNMSEKMKNLFVRKALRVTLFI